MVRERGLERRLVIEARRVSAQHAKLGELCEAWAQAVVDGAAAEIAGAFDRFAEALVAHFDVEEKIHFPALHGADGSLESDLARVLLEHADFRRELAVFRAAIRAGGYASAEEVAAFAARLSEHERFEESLFPPLPT